MLRASELPTAQYLDEEGEHIVVVVDYFRRNSTSGLPIIHARMEVLRTMGPKGWHADNLGMKVTRPFPVVGAGVEFTGDMLRATGNGDLDVDPTDDEAVARAFCLQPVRCLARRSPLIESRNRPGVMVRFMNLVQLRTLDDEARAAIADWERQEPADWASLCAPDPRRRR